MTLDQYAIKYQLSYHEVTQVANYIDPDTQPIWFERELESMAIVNQDWLDRILMESVSDHYEQVLAKMVDDLLA